MLDLKPYNSYKKTEASKSQTQLIAIILSDISPQARGKKENINKWDYFKLKSFYTAKENNKIKRQSTEWENKFADASDKGLISEIYKLLTKLYASSLDWVKITQEQ